MMDALLATVRINHSQIIIIFQLFKSINRGFYQIYLFIFIMILTYFKPSDKQIGLKQTLQLYGFNVNPGKRIYYNSVA